MYLDNDFDKEGGAGLPERDPRRRLQRRGAPGLRRGAAEAEAVRRGDQGVPEGGRRQRRSLSRLLQHRAHLRAARRQEERQGVARQVHQGLLGQGGTRARQGRQRRDVRARRAVTRRARHGSIPSPRSPSPQGDSCESWLSLQRSSLRAALARAEARLDGGQIDHGVVVEARLGSQFSTSSTGTTPGSGTTFAGVSGGIFGGYKIKRFIFGLGFDLARVASGASVSGNNTTSRRPRRRSCSRRG